MSARRLPDWLKKLEIKTTDSGSEFESNDELGEHSIGSKKNAKPCSEEVKSDDHKDNEEEDEEFLSSSKHLPCIEYKGRVEYYTELHDIAIASDTLTKWVDEQDKEIVPIAFDMEWPFSFQTGSGKSSVIQLCADVNVCYVFHISRLKKLPAALVHLLQHSKVRLHGVNIKNDCRKLERDFKEVNSQLMIDHCFDLGVWCNQVINSNGRWSMARLVLHICKLRINKDPKVRMSKWHIQPLTKEQQVYAAIDVYIAQVIYYDLEKRQKERSEREWAFVEKYGEEAYKRMRLVHILRAGPLDYANGLKLQQKVAAQVNRADNFKNILILTSHPPVYTIGIRTTNYTIDDEERLRKLGAQFFKTNRGGLITFHGPGQMVVYPILNLKDFKPSIRWYVCHIEKTIIDLCKEFGISANTSPDTGVWVDDMKICAIGVHGSRYITTHGLALNCNTELKWFEHIVPCGIEGKGVTSLSRELNRDVTIDEMEEPFLRSFSKIFDCELKELDVDNKLEFMS